MTGPLMAQQVKPFATIIEDLSLISETHMVDRKS